MSVFYFSTYLIPTPSAPSEVVMITNSLTGERQIKSIVPTNVRYVPTYPVPVLPQPDEKPKHAV